MLIKERAKITDPTSTLVSREDLDFEPALKKAIDDKIFDSGDTKLLRTFLYGGNKAIFDNVAHKPGEKTLINKDDLNDAVDMLEKLLQSVEY